MDLLGVALRALRFKSAVFCRLSGGTPWALAVPPVGGASFHVVLAGRCHIDSEVGDIELHAGDVCLVISGCAQVLGDKKGRDPTPLNVLIEDMEKTGGITASLGPPPVRTEVVCGGFFFDRRLFDPVLRFLPPVVQLRPGQYQSRLLGSMLDAVRAELADVRPASDVVLSRLGDVLFVEILRTALAEGLVSPDHQSWVRALAVPEIQRALEAAHADLSAKWTVDALASRAGLSRSAFTARFREVVGMSPLEYVTHWRMTDAAALLADTRQAIPEIAQRVGYGSEAAFSKAFKAVVGVPPGRYRAEADARSRFAGRHGGPARS